MQGAHYHTKFMFLGLSTLFMMSVCAYVSTHSTNYVYVIGNLSCEVAVFLKMSELVSFGLIV